MAADVAMSMFNKTYWSEPVEHWRALLSAMIGLGFGIGLNAYTTSMFAPHLIKEFGWTKSAFALLGSFSLLMLVVQPITGRLTDRYGVKRVAAVGVFCLPVAFLIYANMTGDIRMLYAASIVQMTLGSVTTTPVYSRLVAERFVHARGLAFSIVMSGPPIAGFFIAPMLDGYINAHGWRDGYYWLCAVSLFFSVLSLLLMPPQHNSIKEHAARTKADRRMDYRVIVRSPAFWILIAGMLLINLPQSLITSQIKLMLIDSGAASAIATNLVSLFAVGVVAGRFACGLTLDRLAAHNVAAWCLGLPGIGLLLLASPFDSTPVLMTGILLLGFAQGGEGDIIAYLVARHFRLNIYSLVMSLVGATIASATAIGSILLSTSLRHWDNFVPFLYFSTVVTLLGALLLLLLGRLPTDQAKGI